VAGAPGLPSFLPPSFSLLLEMSGGSVPIGGNLMPFGRARLTHNGPIKSIGGADD
jgi:hypothetical protein